MKVICYDTAGNVLVEHKTSLAGTGYPVDVALSANGEVMQVVYLYTQNGQMVSRLYYYNFGKAGKDEADHKVSGKNYKNTILASGFFMDADTSVAIGDDCMAIYSGKVRKDKDGQRDQKCIS